MNANPTTARRIVSIDILRGLVMIIMALDHARDYLHVSAMTADPLDPSTTTAALFFTRWITHFCAPVFVLLSGVSARISAARRSEADMARFLWKRGLWLVIIEVTVVTFGITFDPGFHFVILQVIWVIGASMMLLALFIRYFKGAILWFGLLLFLGHNVLDYLKIPTDGFAGGAMQVLFTALGTVIPVTKTHFIGVFYTLLPWTSILFLGYAMGSWFLPGVDQAYRRKKLLQTGSLLIAGFLVFRFFNIYGNPQPWVHGKNLAESLYSFLATSKYPPSLLYACMTLGPALLLLAWFERWPARRGHFAEVYGRVPFFYYICHFYLLHLVLAASFFITGHSQAEIHDPNSIFFFRPVQFGFPLWIVYLLWLSVVLALYYPCRWFGRYKMSHAQWWLRYL